MGSDSNEQCSFHVNTQVRAILHKSKIKQFTPKTFRISRGDKIVPHPDKNQEPCASNLLI